MDNKKSWIFIPDNNGEPVRRKAFYQTDFFSESTDLGIAYVENYHNRKIETLSAQDIKNALLNAAEKGNGNPNITNLEFVRELMTNKIVMKLGKDDRMEIYKIAAEANIPKLKDLNEVLA